MHEVSTVPSSVQGPQGPGSPGPPDEQLHIRPERPPDVRFLLDRQEGRFGGAFGVSVASHVVGVALVMFLVSIAPPPATFPLQALDRENYDIVWLPEEGPGGGGGGGGNESLEPPRQVEMPGRDAISLPVAKPPDVVQPPREEAPEPPPIDSLNIPAVAMASGLEHIPGTLTGIPDPGSTSQGSGSGGGAGTGRGTGIGPGQGSGLGPGWGGGTGGGAYRPGAGITNPRLIREVRPNYTADALRAKIQGEVLIEAIVLPDGTVGDAHVIRSLDPVFGIDEEALRTARQWRFVPGTKGGVPVPVIVTIAISFRLY